MTMCFNKEPGAAEVEVSALASATPVDPTEPACV